MTEDEESESDSWSRSYQKVSTELVDLVRQRQVSLGGLLGGFIEEQPRSRVAEIDEAVICQ